MNLCPKCNSENDSMRFTCKQCGYDLKKEHQDKISFSEKENIKRFKYYLVYLLMTTPVIILFTIILFTRMSLGIALYIFGIGTIWLYIVTYIYVMKYFKFLAIIDLIFMSSLGTVIYIIFAPIIIIILLLISMIQVIKHCLANRKRVKKTSIK